MNGNKIFLDTNIILYLLEGNQELANLLNGIELYISVISEIELLGYQNISDDEKLKLKSFLNECQIIPLHNEIKDSCIELKQRHKIKTPDAIVASSANFLNMPLLTADKGFENLSDSKILLYRL
jgi:predicted nucleic acid-binding protein